MGLSIGIGWIVAGSADTLAHGAADFTPDMARSTRDQCAAAGVPFWLKQMCFDECERCHGGCDDPVQPADHGDPRNPCEDCGGYGQHAYRAVRRSPYLDGRQHLYAPAPIARILRERGKP